MYKYAQIDENNVVIGISDLSGIVEHPSVVLLDEDATVLPGYLYDPESGEFTAPVLPEPEPTPNPIPVDPIQQLIELQAQTVLNTEMLLLQKEIGI